VKQGDVFPGSKRLVEGEMPPSSLLLIGPSGIGKTIFSKQFIFNGLTNNESGIYLSTDESSDRIEKTMKSFGFDPEPYKSNNTFRVVDCYAWRIGGKSCNRYCVSNPADLAAVSSAVDSARQGLTKTRLVLDSITGLMSICNHNLTFLSKFLQVMVAKNRAADSNAIFLVTPEAHDQVFMSYLREIFDGTLEMKMETKKSDSNEEIVRLLRLFSLKGTRHKTNWTPFEITSEGINVKRETETRCLMCSRLIEWEPHVETIDGKEYGFDSAECARTYRRLKGLYGPSFE